MLQPTLPPIPFEQSPFIPRPDALELPFDSAWEAWDQAVREMDARELLSHRDIVLTRGKQ